MSFTEFCCRSGGSNLNAGTRTGNTTEPGTSADLTYASGNWVQSTRVFTVASGDPVADGVAVGDWVSVYADGATVTGYIGRVTARTSTTITISSTAIGGTAPTDGTGNRTVKVGGAWKGPNGAENFPFGLATATMTNSSTHPPRVNLKDDAQYDVTASIAHTLNGVTFQGYTSAYGDLGKATIDAGGNAVVILNMTGQRMSLIDLIVANNGSSGTNAGISNGGSNGVHCIRCVAHGIRGTGIICERAIECEAYDCNKSNSANLAGINAGEFAIRCISHDNTSGTNAHGFADNGYHFNCIADSNAGSNYKRVGSAEYGLVNCDSYNPGVDHYDAGSSLSGVSFLANNNFIKAAAGYGIHGYGMGYPIIAINNAYGAGTMANASGNTTGGDVNETGAINYAANVTPWIDPDNGDFRINLATAKGAGRGAFTQTAASYAGTIGYPDIGAAQHLESGGGATARRTVQV